MNNLTNICKSCKQEYIRYRCPENAINQCRECFDTGLSMSDD